MAAVPEPLGGKEVIPPRKGNKKGNKIGTFVNWRSEAARKKGRNLAREP